MESFQRLIYILGGMSLIFPKLTLEVNL